MWRYPCGVCGVGANAVLCIICGMWCQTKCSSLSTTAVSRFQCPAGARVGVRGAIGCSGVWLC